MEWTIAAIGLVGAFVSGVFGIGGALILIPLLLYVPPAVAGEALSVQAVSGLSIVQVVAASVLGALAHGRRGYADRRLIVRVGLPMQMAGVLGGAGAALLPGAWLVLLFALVATLAAVLLVMPGVREQDPEGSDVPGWLPAGSVGGGVGLVGGLLGAGGAFLLLPLLIRVLGTPTRLAIGSSLAITLLGSAAALVGKLATGQVPLGLVPWALAGTLPGALLGVQVSHRLRAAHLRGLLGVLVVVIALRSWWDALARLAGA